jgi:hypothetical protein
MREPTRKEKTAMTQDQQTEWNYRFDERMGILTQGHPATVLDEAMARADANAWLFLDQCENGGGEF